MKTIGQYHEDISNLMKKSKDIDAQATTENRELNEAEILLKNEILDTVEDLNKTVQTLERQEKLNNLLESGSKKETIENGKKEVRKSDSKEKFQSFGQQLAAIVNASKEGGRIDPRLYNANGMNETIPSQGGFLVQQDFSTELLQEVMQTGVLASRCKRLQISGNANSIKINGVDETSRASTRSGGVVSYWKAEAAQATSSKPSFRTIELNLKKLIGLCYATDELLADSSALESYVRQAFVAEAGFKLDDAIINGTGAGQPLGILNSGALVSQAKETGQKAATIVAENIMKMRARLFANSRKNACWLINQNIEPQLHSLSLAVGTGGVPVYLPANGLSGLPYDSLYGMPVIPIEQAATLGTVGDIILADLPNGYILAEKGGIESAMSIHIKFDYDESCFRFILRVDGQPVRASVLTPYKGSSSTDTQSHFVALATRS